MKAVSGQDLNPVSCRTRFTEMGLSLLVFWGTFIWVFRFSIIDFDPHHAGVMYKTALDVSRGLKLFRDTFTQYGALTAYLQAMAIRIFGERVTSILFSAAIFYAADYTLLYRLSRHFFGRGMSFLVLALTLFLAPYYMWQFHPWSSIYALFFMLLVTFAVMFAMRRHPYVHSFFAGLCSLLAFWCRQPVGIVCLLGAMLCVIFFALARRKCDRQGSDRLFRSLVWLFAGALLGFLLFFVPILCFGGLSDFYRQCIKGMFSFAVSRSQNGGIFGMMLYRLLIAPLREWASAMNYIWLLLPLSSVALCILSAVRYIREIKETGRPGSDRNAALIIYTVFAVASWHQYYPVSCYRHWYWAAFPSVLSAVLLLPQIIDALIRRFRSLKIRDSGRKWILALSILLLFGHNVGYRAVYGVQRQINIRQQVMFENSDYTHLNGLYLSKETAQYYNELFDSISYLQEQFPEKNVVNMTENGINAVFGENFCPLFNNAGNFYYEEYPALLSEYIRENRPIVIGPALPAEDYCLFDSPKGDSGDWYAAYHNMPANIYIPRELYDLLSDSVGS